MNASVLLFVLTFLFAVGCMMVWAVMLWVAGDVMGALADILRYCRRVVAPEEEPKGLETAVVLFRVLAVMALLFGAVVSILMLVSVLQDGLPDFVQAGG